MRNPIKNTLQSFVANQLFPSKNGMQNWYQEKGYIENTDAKRFNKFLEAQLKEGSYYHTEFSKLNKISRDFININSPNAINTKIDTVTFVPNNNPDLPGNDKHIVNFFGANTYYEGNFRDMANEAAETGATIHAFNYPGFNSSTGKIKEVADLIECGIEVVHNLIAQGIKPDDIIFQGDCFGAAIAENVKEHFKTQQVYFRSINSNSFVSFENAVNDFFNSHTLLIPFKPIVALLLHYTGWNIEVSNIERQDPFLFQMQREGDGVLINSQLQKHIAKNIDAGIDNCPDEYKDDRNILESKSLVKLKEQYKIDKNGQLNEPHMMDLYQLEGQSGESVFSIINEYLSASNKYLAQHSPNKDLSGLKLSKIVKREEFIPNNEEMDQLSQLANTIKRNPELSDKSSDRSII